jgi:hypothetical protein
MKKSTILFLFSLLLIASASSCKKRKAEKNLIGSFTRVNPNNVYSDSTSQILLNSTSISFYDNNNGATGGDFVSNYSYETEKSDIEDYDLEIIFTDLNWSDWLPKNYVWNGSDYVNTVVPNTPLLEQIKFYVRTSESGLELIIKYPEITEAQVFN